MFRGNAGSRRSQAEAPSLVDLSSYCSKVPSKGLATVASMLLSCYSPRIVVIFASSATLLLLLTWIIFGRTGDIHLSHSSLYDSVDQIQNQSLGVSTAFQYCIFTSFQTIFAINLPERSDHRDAMSLAAALTNINIEYVDGVTKVADRILPPGGPETKLKQSELGNWRAHMNVLRMIVERNITSALILEDDADWDIRIKSQMQSFAKATRILVQPLRGSTNQFLDPSYPYPGKEQQSQDIKLEEATRVEMPDSSPYGDIHRWDLLWLGHCGAKFPPAMNGQVPLGRVVMLNDETVPEPQHIVKQWGDEFLVEQYPPHTRVVSRVGTNTCTLGYAVSLPGARRLLYEMGVNKLEGQTDLTLRSICTGSDGRRSRSCLTVQPQLFQHHRPRGSEASFSDISAYDANTNGQAYTRNVRWSTRLNFAKLVDGEVDYLDLFGDGQPAREDLGFG